MFNALYQSYEFLDGVLEHRVIEELAMREATVLPPLGITADRGTVTLSGRVDTHATKGIILSIVWRIPGVHRIIDGIEVVASSAVRRRHLSLERIL